MEQSPATEARIAELTANLRESKTVAANGLRRLLTAEQEVAAYLEKNGVFLEAPDDTFYGLFAEWDKTPDEDKIQEMIEALTNK